MSGKPVELVSHTFEKLEAAAIDVVSFISRNTGFVSTPEQQYPPGFDEVTAPLGDCLFTLLNAVDEGQLGMEEMVLRFIRVFEKGNAEVSAIILSRLLMINREMGDPTNVAFQKMMNDLPLEDFNRREAIDRVMEELAKDLHKKRG